MRGGVAGDGSALLVGARLGAPRQVSVEAPSSPAPIPCTPPFPAMFTVAVFGLSLDPLAPRYLPSLRKSRAMFARTLNRATTIARHLEKRLTPRHAHANTCKRTRANTHTHARAHTHPRSLTSDPFAFAHAQWSRRQLKAPVGSIPSHQPQPPEPSRTLLTSGSPALPPGAKPDLDRGHWRRGPRRRPLATGEPVAGPHVSMPAKGMGEGTRQPVGGIAPERL